MQNLEKMQTALKQAIQLEADGIEYYSKAAIHAKNKATKKVFEELMKEERDHIKAIKEIHNRLTETKKWEPSVISEEPALPFQSIFKMVKGDDILSAESDLQSLQHAADMEDKGMNMYRDLAEKASLEIEKDFFIELSQAEVEHKKTLLDAYEFLSDPNAWEMKHGGARLDGA